LDVQPADIQLARSRLKVHWSSWKQRFSAMSSSASADVMDSDIDGSSTSLLEVKNQASSSSASSSTMAPSGPTRSAGRRRAALHSSASSVDGSNGLDASLAGSLLALQAEVEQLLRTAHEFEIAQVGI
jgi:hypothetical protein